MNSAHWLKERNVTTRRVVLKSTAWAAARAPDGKPLMVRFRDESSDVLNRIGEWPPVDQFARFS